MFKFLKGKTKGDEYYQVVLKDIFGGNNIEFVQAGCVEEAVDKAKQGLSTYIDAKDLEFVSCERGFIVWE